MDTEQRNVISLFGGESEVGHFALCADCGFDQFYVYSVRGHQHVQCANCNTTYCDGSCAGYRAQHVAGSEKVQ